MEVMAVVIVMVITTVMTMMVAKTMRNSASKQSVTDLHTHILPAFDDGAKSVQMAVKMLRQEREFGVERVALTPHYYPTREGLDAFIARREQAYTALRECCIEKAMPQLCLGAEVHYAPLLTKLDLHKLTIGVSNYLLLELSDYGVAPYLKQVVANMLSQGITPIIAHVERCEIFRNDPDQLADLIQMGALAQVTMRKLTERRNADFAKICLKNGLAHIIASDFHNPSDGSLELADRLRDRYEEILVWTEQFARAVWDNTPPPPFAIHPVKKGLFGYR